MNKDQTFHVKISQELWARLLKQKEKTGSPVSEILRRAADKYLKDLESKQDQKEKTGSLVSEILRRAADKYLKDLESKQDQDE